MNISRILLAAAAIPLMTACTGSSTSTPDDKEAPMKVIFETDMGNDVDDALALDMLMKYVDNGQIELLGISSNKRNEGSTEYIDIMTNWYGHPEIPLGYVVDGAPCDDAVNYAQEVCNMTDSTGSPLFARAHAADSFMKPSVALYRELLAAQPDSSVTIISVGFSTNLAQLLDSEADEASELNGRDLVSRKVNRLVTMAGEFRANEDPDTMKRMPEYNIVRDVEAARKVFAQWPTEIVTSPFELGIDVPYPASSIENDFTWTQAHPMVEAYKCYLPMPYDRPTWDLTSVLYAVEGEGDYFTLSAPGTITVDGRGGTGFTPSPDGKHRILQSDSIQGANITRRFVELISAPPANKAE